MDTEIINNICTKHLYIHTNINTFHVIHKHTCIYTYIMHTYYIYQTEYNTIHHTYIIIHTENHMYSLIS